MQTVIDFVAHSWKPLIEVGVFWYGYFILLRFLRSTGALQVLKGLFLLVILFVIVQFLGLTTISRLMREALPISVIGFVVVFQNEIRRGLGRIGQSSIFKLLIKEEKIIDEVVRTVFALSAKRIGAIIAFERQVSLKQYAETGVNIDGILSFELLSTVFIPATPLHDGGIVIVGNRIASAGCLFPLSESPRISKGLGTRHRAALGLTEETDAIVVVVSEESGVVSVSENGEFTRDVDSAQLKEILKSLYTQDKGQHKSLKEMLSFGDSKA